jgi:uncharacterized protein YlaI
MDYNEYIMSEAWAQKKQAFKEYAFKSKDIRKRMCGGCLKPWAPGFHVHHKTYKRLGNERINVDLIYMCRDCHEELHNKHKESDKSLWHFTKKFCKNKQNNERKRLLKKKNENKSMDKITIDAIYNGKKVSTFLTIDLIKDIQKIMGMELETRLNKFILDELSPAWAIPGKGNITFKLHVKGHTVSSTFNRDMVEKALKPIGNHDIRTEMINLIMGDLMKQMWSKINGQK